MHNAKRAQQMFNLPMYVEKIIDMASEAARASEVLRLSEKIDDFSGDIYDRKIHPSVKPIHDRMFCGGSDDDDILEALNGWPSELCGICLQVSTPIKRKSGDSLSYSWGYCKLVWVYGDTYEEAYQLAAEWVSGLEPEDE